MTFAVIAAPRCAVPLIDVLNNFFALVARRQIKIDVRPFAAVLAQEALKEQLHPDRIDGRDFECITDGRVRRRAAPLHQNAVLLAVADDVPHDEEVAGKAELGDQREFALNLRARLVEQMRLAGEP